MPIKRPKSTATPGNPIECLCDNCEEVIAQGETETEALTIAENRGADIGILPDPAITCKTCYLRKYAMDITSNFDMPHEIDPTTGQIKNFIFAKKENTMDKIVLLAQARAKAAHAALYKKTLMDEFTNSNHFSAVKAEADATAAEVERLEKEIKAEYEGTFTGDKHPHPVINLKEFDGPMPKYDERQALTWCMTNYTAAVKLDKATFEKEVKAGKVPAEIAEKPAKEIRAQIAADLSAYL